MNGQNEMVLSYMKQFGSITPLDAMQDLGCMRLSARIKNLRDAGHPIGRRWRTCTNRFGNTVRFAEYYINGNFKEGKYEQCESDRKDL